MVTEKQLWELLEHVSDPEVPVLTIVDLGIVRKVDVSPNGQVEITITPTYSGCPAMNYIEKSIHQCMEENNIAPVFIKTELSPAWTTDWMSENGRKKLKEYGIAPPVDEPDKHVLFGRKPTVPCPRCNSEHTKMLSQFGSTSCKALFQCQECQEPFEYFKCLK